MKLEAQKDIQISQMRLTPMSTYLVQQRYEKRKKAVKKGQDSKRKQVKKLKQIIQRQKVSQIKKQFARKLRMLVPPKVIPLELLVFRKEPTDLFDRFVLKLEQMQGFKISSTFLFLWRFFILLKVIIILVITSLLLVFHQVHQIHFFQVIMTMSVLISIVDIWINLVFQKFQNNKNRKNILSIAKLYIKKDFIVDLTVTITSTILKMWLSRACVCILIVVSFIKLWKSLQRIQVLQHVYITNVFQQKYYAIGRVIFLNFLIAHFIAIILLLMGKINSEQNWLIQKQIQNAQWFEQYVWSCYWAANIMLTVGFGDISASNYKQALILIFVETFSCIILAYNINVVGSILTDIKQKQRQRKSQLRTLIKMSQQNQTQKQLVEQAFNYVDQSFKINQRFCYELHDTIVQNLPQSIQQQYIKHANKKMILQSPLANLFSQKSLMKVALNINRKLAHPQQIIWKRGQPLRFVILKKGKLGLTYRRGNSVLNGQIIQSLQINSKKSKLFSINFLRNQQFSYDIKSLDYSVIYHLSQQQFAEALKQKNSDYQIYCSIRDKCEFKLQAGDLYKCSFCPGDRHEYLNCPKMHLVIISGYVLFKNVYSKKNITNARQFLPRKNEKKQFLKKSKQIKSEILSFNMINGVNQDYQKPLRNTNSFRSIVSCKASTKSNISLSNIFKDMDIQRLNTFLVAKMNEKELCVGFWDVECDIAHNFISYFRANNADNIGRQPGNKRIQRLNSITLNQNT